VTGSDERGIALLIALVALGVIGALVGGIFFAARLEQQSGQNALYAVQAGEAAEAGLSEAVATLDPAASSRCRWEARRSTSAP
jgi:type II secretory pathway component PulK